MCHVSRPLQKMAKRRFSALEITLIVLFLLMFAVAVAMIVLYVVDPKSSTDGNEGGETEGEWAGLDGAGRARGPGATHVY